MATTTTKFEYTTNSTRSTEKCDSLGKTLGGPVKVSSNHMLAVALEQAGFKLPAAGAGFVTIEMRMIDDLTQTNLIFDEALDGQHIAWHVVPTRLSTLFRSLEGAGVSLSGRYADIRSTLTRAIGELPDGERLIKKTETLSPGTALAGWYSSATAAACRGLGSDNSRLLMLRAMMPTPYADDTAKDLTVVACAGMLSGPTTAADPLGKFLEIITSLPGPPRPQLQRYIPAAGAPFEIKRQMADSEVGRFTPLFDDAYKFAYPNIAKAFPAITQAVELRTTIATIFTRLGITTGLTDASVSLLDEWASQALPNLGVISTDSQGTAARVNTLVNSVAADTHGARSQGGAASDDSKGKASDYHDINSLYAKSEYAELIQRVEAIISTSPINYSELAAALMRSKCVAGWMRMTGIDFSVKQLKACRPVTLPVSKEHIRVAINTLLTKGTSAATTAPDGGRMLATEELVEATVLGKLSPGSGAQELDWWRAFAPFVKADKGPDSLSKFRKPESPSHILLDPDILRAIVKVVEPWFEFMGWKWPPNSPGSIAAVLRNFAKRAEQLQNMRPTETKRKGHVNAYINAAKRILDDFASTVRTMLKSPAGSAERAPTVLTAGTPAHSKWIAFESALDKTIEKHSVNDEGLGSDDDAVLPTVAVSLASLIGSSSGPSSLLTANTPTAPTHVARSTAGSGYDMTSVSQWHSPPSWRHEPEYEEHPDGVGPGWGDSTYKHGVVLKEGAIYCGENRWDPDAAYELSDLKCLAQISPPVNPEDRGKFCSTPKVCTDASCHARPDGVNVVRTVTRHDQWDVNGVEKKGHGLSINQITENATILVAAHPEYAFQRAYKRPREDQQQWGRGKGGKGRGKGLARGKPTGKGGGKGKPEGKGKGKGKGGGKGAYPFGREW